MVHFDEICRVITANCFQISRSAIKKGGRFDPFDKVVGVIQSLEVKLHQPATRSDLAAVSELLHEEFALANAMTNRKLWQLCRWKVTRQKFLLTGLS
ncbi:hypothetical protein [Serratia proteamaculans]